MTNMHIRSWGTTDYIERLAAHKAQQGAEVGVLEGSFSEIITRGLPHLHMYLIDPWMYDATWGEITNLPQQVQDLRHQLVVAKFPNHTVLRMTSEEAAKVVPDGSLDFVYIDGRHEKDFIEQDLKLWFPKLKANGILSGHDYDLGHVEVVNAVNQWAHKHDQDIYICTDTGIWVIR